ncbi:hypothetical protein [Methanothrix sp.]|uniref:hypothetical protein n=1 Tax=Methanothrix sp. TaxID=90426 RepID=UPI003297557C
MLLPGIVWQPKGSFEVWNIMENDFPRNGSSEEKMTFLLNYAILAPSIYNTQPWRFNVSDGSIMVMADESRWLEAADGNKREMYLAIGGAIENLIIAADHFGFSSTVSYFPDPTLLKSDLSESYDIVARVSFQPGAFPSMDSRLFYAITLGEMNASRIVNESLNEQKGMNRDLDKLVEAIGGLKTDQDISIILSDDPKTRKGILSLTEAADRSLYSDITFKSELGHWLSLGGMGPTGFHAKVDQIKVLFLDSLPGQIKMDTEVINSSPYLGFIASSKNDRESQVRAGRLLGRISLLSSSYGSSLVSMGRALQSEETESGAVGLRVEVDGDANGSIVQQIFCLRSSGSTSELTPRRPLEEVLV